MAFGHRRGIACVPDQCFVVPSAYIERVSQFCSLILYIYNKVPFDPFRDL